MRIAALILVITAAASAGIVDDVRALVAQGQFPAASASLKSYRAQHGATPELLEAISWMARGAFAFKRLDQAEAYAEETQRLTAAQLKSRSLDSDHHLAIALGAAIEVEANVRAERGDRAGAVTLLRRELATYRATSIAARIQKNINLLTLEGKPAPALDGREYLGVKPLPLAALKGKPVLLFFWAHWCSDCKAEEPLLARLRREYASKGLAVIAPTQRYGYAARGEDATAAAELKYIDEIRHGFYSDLLDVPVPVSEANFSSYGASTTPTLVFIDRRGIVRLYHPGAMSMEELRSAVNSIL